MMPSERLLNQADSSPIARPVFGFRVSISPHLQRDDGPAEFDALKTYFEPEPVSHES